MSTPNQKEAARFLAALDPEATFFTFQTFDDNKERKDQKLVRVLHGSLAEHWPTLQSLNEQGAGIFVTVNETDGKGRKKENIVRVRALYDDLDGAPLEPVLANGRPPHIITETSPQRWHTYWRVFDFPLDQFTSAQKALIECFGGDPSVHDLPRVMRLPGFIHRKGEPFLTRIVSTSEAPPYKPTDFPQAKPKEAPKPVQRPDETNEWWRKLNADALANLAAWVPPLFPAARPYHDGFRVSSEALGRDLEEDLSITPLGIKDFGVHDIGDPREGRRSPIDIVKEFGRKDLGQAVAWLRRQLGQLPDNGMTEEQQTEIARLAALPSVQYDQQRIEAAKQLGIRVGTLDQLVDCVRPRRDDVVGQGTPLSFAAIVPYPEPVDGEKLIADMEAAIRKHVVLSEQQALAVALWILHAHALEFAEHSPRLHVPSPAPRCGKTTLLNTIAAMVPKPIHTENITTSALFRIIEMVQPTLLMDEADIFLKDNEDMRGLLNAGHSRSGQVIRTVGEDFEPRAFKVWGPVVVAGIGRIPATIEDRSITIALRRRLPDEKIDRLRTNRTGHLDVLLRRAARWVADHRTTLTDADPALPDNLGDREQDNWRPLVAISDAISPSLGGRVRAAAVKIAEEEVDDDNAAIMALADVAAIFETTGMEKLSSHDLITALNNMEDRPWPEWKRGQPMTKNSLARLLKPFSIHPKQMRFAPKPAKTMKGYEAAPIKEAKGRYVDNEPKVSQEDINDPAI
jgi:hypothetical protein